jgi:ribonuclease T2
MKSARTIAIAVCLLALVLSLSARSHRHKQSGPPSNPGGDFYVLALSWAPNFCDDPGKSHSSSECGHNRHFGFIVHGLWPTKAGGGPSPECQGGSPLGDDTVRALLPYIPDRGLIQHEWSKHWSCHGTPQQFADAVKAAATALKIPDKYKEPKQDITINRSQLERDFAAANSASPGDFRVSCHAGKLVNFEACMTDDAKLRSCTELRECPENEITLDAVK